MQDQGTPLAYAITDDDMAALTFWAIDALLLRSEEDLSDSRDEDAERAELGRLIATARGLGNVAAWNVATAARVAGSFTLPYSAGEIEEARSGELTSRRVDDFLR